MHIVIAPDSFKECLSARSVAQSIADGIKMVIPEAKIIQIPVADGGEGTVEALVTATGGKLTEAKAHDPLMRPISCYYGVLGDNQTAVIEMASASGLELLTIQERNPLISSTYGTGELIISALNAGYKNIVIGLGGSATNDGGAGMAQALGVKLLDFQGSEILPGGENLASLVHIDVSGINPLVKKAQITVACDVSNPLCGPRGASYIYGVQKGGQPNMLKVLDKNLMHWGKLIKKELKKDILNLPGSGAAGGLGAGLLAFTNAELKPGFEIIKSITNLENHIQNANLVFTAEGKIDFQTQFGKTPFGVAQIAKRYGIPVIAITGVIGDGADILYQKGINSIFSIVDGPMSLEDSIDNAEVLLRNTAERIMRVVNIAKL